MRVPIGREGRQERRKGGGANRELALGGGGGASAAPRTKNAGQTLVIDNETRVTTPWPRASARAQHRCCCRGERRERPVWAVRPEGCRFSRIVYTFERGRTDGWRVGGAIAMKSSLRGGRATPSPPFFLAPKPSSSPLSKTGPFPRSQPLNPLRLPCWGCSSQLFAVL